RRRRIVAESSRSRESMTLVSRSPQAGHRIGRLVLPAPLPVVVCWDHTTRCGRQVRSGNLGRPCVVSAPTTAGRDRAGTARGGAMHRRLRLALFGGTLATLLAAAPVLACGGLIGPNG